MSPLQRLKGWLTGTDEGGARAAKPDPVLAASAALMAEIMRADGSFDARERAELLEHLMSQGGADAAVAQALLTEAEAAAESAHDLFQFTALINAHCDAPARVEIVERLWGVAFADGKLDHHEAHLVKRIADLLYVRHSDYIAAKQRARARVLGH